MELEQGYVVSREPEFDLEDRVRLIVKLWGRGGRRWTRKDR